MGNSTLRNAKWSSPPPEGSQTSRKRNIARGVGQTSPTKHFSKEVSYTLPMILVLTMAAQCVKHALPVATCQRVYVLADYYRLDTVYLRTDSLWPWGRLNNAFCGRDTLVFTKYEPKPVQVCGTSQLVAVRYVVGNKVTQSKIFK